MKMKFLLSAALIAAIWNCVGADDNWNQYVNGRFSAIGPDHIQDVNGNKLTLQNGTTSLKESFENSYALTQIGRTAALENKSLEEIKAQATINNEAKQLGWLVFSTAYKVAKEKQIVKYDSFLNDVTSVNESEHLKRDAEIYFKNFGLLEYINSYIDKDLQQDESIDFTVWTNNTNANNRSKDLKQKYEDFKEKFKITTSADKKTNGAQMPEGFPPPPVGINQPQNGTPEPISQYTNQAYEDRIKELQKKIKTQEEQIDKAKEEISQRDKQLEMLAEREKNISERENEISKNLNEQDSAKMQLFAGCLNNVHKENKEPLNNLKLLCNSLINKIKNFNDKTNIDQLKNDMQKKFLTEKDLEEINKLKDLKNWQLSSKFYRSDWKHFTINAVTFKCSFKKDPSNFSKEITHNYSYSEIFSEINESLTNFQKHYCTGTAFNKITNINDIKKNLSSLKGYLEYELEKCETAITKLDKEHEKELETCYNIVSKASFDDLKIQNEQKIKNLKTEIDKLQEQVKNKDDDLFKKNEEIEKLKQEITRLKAGQKTGDQIHSRTRPTGDDESNDIKAKNRAITITPKLLNQSKLSQTPKKSNISEETLKKELIEKFKGEKVPADKAKERTDIVCFLKEIIQKEILNNTYEYTDDDLKYLALLVENVLYKKKPTCFNELKSEKTAYEKHETTDLKVINCIVHALTLILAPSINMFQENNTNQDLKSCVKDDVFCHRFEQIYNNYDNIYGSDDNEDQSEDWPSDA